MATGAPEHEIYIPNILVSAYPDLASNFNFLNSFDIANVVAGDSYNRLKKLGYAVKLEQNLTGAGGIGILPSIFETIRMCWENKTIITLPIAFAKFFYNRIKHGSSKLPAQSRRLAKVHVNLMAYSKTLRMENGVFINKESILNTLLEGAVILAPLLQDNYPHISFTFELEIKLEEHKAQLVYTLDASELRYRRLPLLFRAVALNKYMTSRINITKKLLFKREDWKVKEKLTGPVWCYEARTKKFYYITVGRLFSRDYISPNDQANR